VYCSCVCVLSPPLVMNKDEYIIARSMPLCIADVKRIAPGMSQVSSSTSSSSSSSSSSPSSEFSTSQVICQSNFIPRNQRPSQVPGYAALRPTLETILSRNLRWSDHVDRLLFLSGVVSPSHCPSHRLKQSLSSPRRRQQWRKCIAQTDRS